MAISRSQMQTQLTGDKMPAKSEKQRKFMAAVANNPKFAKKVGVPQNVGEEFMKTKKYQRGGMTERQRNMDRASELEGMEASEMGMAPPKTSAPLESMRPKARPTRAAPVSSLRPKARPAMDDDMSAESAVGRGNRAAMREAEDMPQMKKGGKVKKPKLKKVMGSGASKSSAKARGYGMARGGKVCKMR